MNCPPKAVVAGFVAFLARCSYFSFPSKIQSRQQVRARLAVIKVNEFGSDTCLAAQEHKLKFLFISRYVVIFDQKKYPSRIIRAM